MHTLHVGSRPNALPCREEEYARVLKCVGELLEEGSGGCICKFVCFVSCHELCIYDQISPPGTGKTATVHTVIRELKRMAQNNVCRSTSFFEQFLRRRQETNPFTYVEINGLKISEPFAAYNLLWEGNLRT